MIVMCNFFLPTSSIHFLPLFRSQNKWIYETITALLLSALFLNDLLPSSSQFLYLLGLFLFPNPFLGGTTSDLFFFINQQFVSKLVSCHSATLHIRKPEFPGHRFSTQVYNYSFLCYCHLFYKNPSMYKAAIVFPINFHFYSRTKQEFQSLPINQPLHSRGHLETYLCSYSSLNLFFLSARGHTDKAFSEFCLTHTLVKTALRPPCTANIFVIF